MAKVNRDQLKLNTGGVIANTSSNGAFQVDLRGVDCKTLLMFANSSGSPAKVTIPHGDGVQGAGADLVVNVANSKTVGLVVDSGVYKTLTGEHAGYLVGSTDQSLSISVVELP